MTSYSAPIQPDDPYMAKILDALGHVVAHTEDGSYWAECTNRPGCFSAGDTPGEVVVNMIEAIVLWEEDAERSQASSCDE